MNKHHSIDDLPAMDEIWERDLYLSKKKQADIAWIIAGAATILSALLMIAVIIMLPLKEVKPIVITVDAYTGLANVESTLGSIELDDEEALTQALIYQFIRDIETYDPTDQNERINEVFNRARDQASRHMQSVFSKDNPLNPQKIYGTSGRVKVKVKTVILTSASTAQASIVLSERSAIRTEAIEKPYVVTLSFGFDRSKAPTLEQRWKNPVGFYVDSYRIDQETL